MIAVDGEKSAAALQKSILKRERRWRIEFLDSVSAVLRFNLLFRSFSFLIITMEENVIPSYDL